MLLPGIGWPGGSLENTAIMVGVVAGAYLGALWLAAIVWTWRDIRSRAADPITHGIAVLIVFLFNLPGWVLYLVLRPPLTLAEAYERQLEEEALLQDLGNDLACPECGVTIEDDYVVCPHCTSRLKQPCIECGRALLFSWAACPWCATPQADPVAVRRRAAASVPTPRPRAVAPAAAPARRVPGAVDPPPESAPIPAVRQARPASDVADTPFHRARPGGVTAPDQTTGLTRPEPQFAATE